MREGFGKCWKVLDTFKTIEFRKNYNERTMFINVGIIDTRVLGEMLENTGNLSNH